MSDISIVIPCYNESTNIPLLLERCAKSFIDKPVEVIIVDNGSIDDTPAILERLLPQYSFARSIRVEKNQGYGHGILSGLAVAKSSYIGWTHADLQTDPADVLKALKILHNTNELLFLKGSRYGRAPIDLLFTIGMSFFDSILLKSRLWDINAQPTIVPRSFFKDWENPPYDFSLDLFAYYMAKKKKLQVKRFSVFFGKRIAGDAHLKNLKAKIKYTFQTIKYSIFLMGNQ